MSIPATRPNLKDWCLRQLGHPVIEINVDDDQVEDRIDEALQYFQDFHFDGTERTYLSHAVTADDITNKYLSVADGISGITRMFSVTQHTLSMNMFDMRYQMRLHDLFDFTTTSVVNWTITQQHLRTLDMLFAGETPIRYNRHTNRVHIDWNWSKLVVGDYVILEGFVVVDPETYTRVYNDRMLKKLSTALIKRQWGNNMKKFDKMQLPGGITMNGQQIYDEANQEVALIEKEIRDSYEAPPMMQVG